MAKLRCCLAGFDAAGASEIEGMAGLVRPHLSADWSFAPAGGTAGASICDLLLCDIGSAPGAMAWRDSALRGGVRAAATEGARVFGGLVLTKPLRPHGPGGLVQLLNEAARLGTAPPGPGLVASGPAASGRSRPALAKRGWLRSLLSAIAAWLSRPAPLAAKPSLAPVPEAPGPARPVQDAAGPVPVTHDILPPDAPVQSRPLARGPAAPTHAVTALAVAGVAELHERDRTLAPRVASSKLVTFDAMGCDLLDLLRRARVASQVIVVRLGGIPAICAAPEIEVCYTFATLQAVFDSPLAALVPTHVTVARNSYLGRLAVQPDNCNRFISVPSFPLGQLLWVATLRCGGADEVARYRDGAFSLTAWPDFASMPHARHHLTWSGMIARRFMTAAALSKATEHDPDEAAIFLAACDELGILRRKELPPGLVPAGPARLALGRAAVPRALLDRLGLQRP